MIDGAARAWRDAQRWLYQLERPRLSPRLLPTAIATHGRLFLAVLALGAAITAVTILHTPAVFEATGIMQLSAHDDAATVRSDVTLSAVIHRLDLLGDPGAEGIRPSAAELGIGETMQTALLDSLRDRIDVLPARANDEVRVIVRADSPFLAARIANAVMAEHLLMPSTETPDYRAKTINVVTDRVAKAREELAKANADVAVIQRRLMSNALLPYETAQDAQRKLVERERVAALARTEFETARQLLARLQGPSPAQRAKGRILAMASPASAVRQGTLYLPALTGLAASFALALLAVRAAALADGRVWSRTDAARLTKMPVTTARRIPTKPTQRRSRMGAVATGLRAIDRALSGRRPRVVALFAADNSGTLAPLALALSQYPNSSERTVLVDVNFAAPTLDAGVSDRTGFGLSDILAEKADPIDGVRQLRNAQCHAIVAGTHSASPDPDELGRVTHELLRDFGRVIFLAGPHTDGAIFAALTRAADQCSVIATAGETSRPALANLAAALRSRAPNTVAVLIEP